MKRSILTTFLMTVFAGFFVANGWAAPSVTSVSGTVSNGQIITVSGTGFGAHSNYSNGGTWKNASMLNRGFKDFEDKSLNSNQFYVGTPSNWAIESTNGRLNSSYHSKKYYNVSRLGALSINSLTQHTEWFAAFWFKMPTGSSSGKPMRVYGGNGANDVTLFAGGNGETNLRGTDGLVTAWGSSGQLKYDTWQRIDFYMRDAGSNDRAVETWVNGKKTWSYVNVPGAWPPAYPYNDAGHTWDFGNLYDGPSGSYQFDDIYVSHTRARVEIGNASTWAASTHRDIQIPNAWTASSIKFIANPGAFVKGNSAYIYVVDSTGAVNSNGYPITIGASSTPTTLSKPQNINIVN